MNYKSFDGEENSNALRIHLLFKKVFCNEDGKRVINILRRNLRFVPKTDIECARLAGMNAVVNMIIDFSGFFGDCNNDGHGIEDNNGRTAD
jgi:hypothetical protein